jgi:hypothetical protein
MTVAVPAADVDQTPSGDRQVESSNPDRGFWAVEPRIGEDGTPDIYFKMIKPGSPADQLALKGDVEQSTSAVLAIYSTEPQSAKRHEAIGRLLKIAQLGLVGTAPGTAEAAAALKLFKNDIVSKEAARIKNGYMLKLGIWAAGFGAVAWTCYVMCDLRPQLFLAQVVKYRNVFLTSTGAFIGGWASFATRKVVLSFEDLAALEDDMVEPPLRLVFTAILTTVLFLIFATGFANVSVGQFNSAGILLSGSVAALTGLLAGLSEKILPAAILKKATSLISSES